MTVGELIAKLSEVKNLNAQVFDGFGWPVSSVTEDIDEEGHFVQISAEEPEVNLR